MLTEKEGDAAAAGRKRPWSLTLLLATGLGFGFSPFAPGTVGALWGLPLAWCVAQLPGVGPFGPAWVQAAVILLLTLGGVPLCTAAAAQIGGAKDPKPVVWDEISTVPIAFFLVPAAQLSMWPPWVWGIGFVLHRLFDVLKPPPCRRLERLPTGLGIMADDFVSSIYACMTLHLVLWAIGRWAGAGLGS